MLKQSDIKRLIDGGETAAVEFKLAKGGVPASLWESYSAFANTDGGVILLGVGESGGRRHVVGVADADKMVAEVTVSTTQETGATTQETTQEIKTVAQETVPATQEKNADVASRILEMLRLEPDISLSRIADSLGLSRDGVKYHINVLKKTMGLRHEGPTKKGHWVIGEA